MRGLMLVIAVGCTSAPSPPSDAGFPECELREGTYRVTIVELVGDCGPWVQPDVALGGEPPFPGTESSCSGPIELDESGCTIEFDRTCEFVEDSMVGRSTYEGSTTITSPETFTGRVEVMDSYEDGSRCSSTYETDGVRL